MRMSMLASMAMLCACASIGGAATPLIDPRLTPEQAGVSEPIYNLTLERQGGGQLLEPRIFGGAVANAGDDPWQVALVLANSSVRNDIFCGGALIAPDWVVTAAHCVANGTSASYFDVVEGAYNLQSTAGRRIRVTRIITHPNFVPTPYGAQTVEGYNDIALLHLAQEARATPIAFAGSEFSSIAADTNARVTGWGQMRNGEIGAELQFLDVNIVSNADCGRPTVHGERIRGTMICAMKPNTRTGFCHGDSGGPLSIAAGERRVLVGVVSIGEEACNLRNIPGVYTRVSAFAPWINACLAGDDVRCRTQ
jgi:trypsin